MYFLCELIMLHNKILNVHQTQVLAKILTFPLKQLLDKVSVNIIFQFT